MPQTRQRKKGSVGPTQDLGGDGRTSTDLEEGRRGRSMGYDRDLLRFHIPEFSLTGCFATAGQINMAPLESSRVSGGLIMALVGAAYE